MFDFTAEQVVEYIANANRTELSETRQKVEQAVREILCDHSKHYGLLVNKIFSEREPTVDDLIVVLQQPLFETLMPKFPGWIWDSGGYRNIGLTGKKKE